MRKSKRKTATPKRTTKKKPRAKSLAKAKAREAQKEQSEFDVEEYIKGKIEELNKGLLFSPEWVGSTLSMIAPENAEWLPTTQAQVLKIDNFLSKEECENIIKVCTPHLRPSTITSGEADFRTSKTSDMASMPSPEEIKTTVDLDVKICNAMNIHPLHAEGSQFQYYQAGEFFKPHTDFFEPGTAEYEEHAKELGQRTWTFMIFLNEPEQGGETEFMNIRNATITPKTGMALAWNNLNQDGTVNRDTLHQGKMVSKGHKAIVTKWFRDKRPV